MNPASPVIETVGTIVSLMSYQVWFTYTKRMSGEVSERTGIVETIRRGRAFKDGSFQYDSKGRWYATVNGKTFDVECITKLTMTPPDMPIDEALASPPPPPAPVFKAERPKLSL